MQKLSTGAEAIAEAVGLKPRQVYALKAGGRAPIRYCEGVGLIADPAELKAWLLGKHREDNVHQA